MKPKELERMIEAAQDYNRPPEPPREEMWAVIRASLPGRAESDGVDELEARRASAGRMYRWTPWAVGLAAAATLAVGFGLGRMTREPVSGAVPVASAPGRTSTPMRLAAAEHMSDAEAMLTLFRSSTEGAGDRTATVSWARDLLTTTRMLLDSRVGEDPKMAELLSDLELVLVQIANSSGDQDDQLIEDGIQQQALLAKLRSAAAPADISSL